MAMDAHHMIAIFATTLAYAALGALAASLHLTLLSVNVRALLGRAHGWLAVAAPLARGAITVAAFFAIALQGAVPLAAALAGFVIARTVAVRRPEILLR
jgi:F1F0 ATPase subunit 2